jgi:hypothetical protein
MNNTLRRRRQEQCRLEDWLITTYSATVLDELQNSESKNRICRYASRHEDMWGSAMKLQPFLTTDLDKASNQLHTQATLLSTRKPYAGGPSGSQSRSGRRSKDSPRPGAPSPSLSLQQSVYWLGYLGSNLMTVQRHISHKSGNVLAYARY